MIHPKLEHNLIPIFAVLLGLGLMVPSIMLHVQANIINPSVFAIDSKPYGTPYAEWAGKWQQERR